MSFLGLFTSTAASDALTPEPPWKAKTVVVAGMTTLAGMAGWISDIASPALARFGGSWGFIISFFTVLAGWIALNAWVLAAGAFDPYTGSWSRQQVLA